MSIIHVFMSPDIDNPQTSKYHSHEHIMLSFTNFGEDNNTYIMLLGATVNFSPYYEIYPLSVSCYMVKYLALLTYKVT